ncbi:MAG TPA: hypothetical protein VFQ31_02025, partial [Methyloceanibacter sp.]|nr:hypothetical protein [Methyloceanibacter sp.]
MSLQIALTCLTLLTSVAVIATLLFGLNRALAAANWPAQEHAGAMRISAAVLVGWFAVALGLALSGIFQAAPDRMPTILLGILLPILIAAWLIWRSDYARRLLEALPQPLLIATQLYRVLGGVFLVLYAIGKMPGLFAWPAGSGDVLVGVLAPIIAIAYARDPAKNGDMVAAWNVFGILDLVVAVATGFATSPSPFQFAEFEQPNVL